MESNHAPNGMVVTPHHLASQSALAVLREGGTAIEAMVAAAATIAVVVPHMNSIGGDGFWLIVPPRGDPIVIEACGAAGSLATPKFFAGDTKIPLFGPKSAITVAGTVGGWQEALDYVTECGYTRMSVSKLLADAIKYAQDGFPVTNSYRTSLENVVNSKQMSSFFSRVYLPEGKLPKIGETFRQAKLAETLKHLAENGLKSFYKGDLAKMIAEDMASLGMPIVESDLTNYSSVRKVPLRLLHSHGELFNSPPPTQGVVSLALLGVLDKLGVDGQHEGQFIHTTVEATKQAFQLRDEYITDPRFMSVNVESLLSSSNLFRMAQNIDYDHASKINNGKGPADTVWMGAMDDKGFCVSFIQSIYHEFGSRVLLPKTGILWHDRGAAFTLDQDHLLSLKPGKKPFHTLNPAAARLHDGRIMVYGTRGGDGQSQTQAAVFHRYVIQKRSLQESVSLPRWLYGTTGSKSDESVKLEDRFSKDTVKYLRDRGHDIVMIPEYSELAGQAGALVRHPDGILEGAFDPRSNGSAAGF